MILDDVEVEHLKETLLTCKADFMELYRTREWFVSDAMDLIDSSLEILGHKEEDDKTENICLGLGDE